MSSKHPNIDPNSLDVHPDDRLAIMAFNWGLGAAQVSEAAENAPQPPEPRGLDFLGAKPPTKSR